MKYAGFSLLFLLLGTLIYCTCRQDVIFLLPLQGSELLEAIKIDIHYTGNPLIYFFLFCLPDVLWYLALLLLQLAFFEKDNLVSKIFLIVVIVLPFAMEFLQKFHLLSGTFDALDILFYSLFLILFLWIERKNLFCV